MKMAPHSLKPTVRTRKNHPPKALLRKDEGETLGKDFTQRGTTMSTEQSVKVQGVGKQRLKLNGAITE